MQSKKKNNFFRLLEIVDELREKCPWDKKQTLSSLRELTIEEVYELSEAILSENHKNIKEELGDILLHIVFYSKIENEKKEFDINDVIDSICKKLIDRHPHIYSNLKLKTDEDVKKNWEKMKMKNEKKTVFEGVPKSLPSLIKTIRIQEKAKGVGFDWDNKEEVWEKVKEEEQEFLDEVKIGNKKKAEEEFGDLLFALTNYARHLDIDPDKSLEICNKKFIDRFNLMEKKINADDKKIYKLNLEEKEKYWIKAKEELQ